MRIISEKIEHTSVEHIHYFIRVGDRTKSGYAFPCDENGTIDVSALNPVAQESYADAMAQVSAGTMRDDGCTTYHHRWIEQAVGACNHCGHPVELGAFTCTCERCGTDYNWAGQELAPREYWGEETGESLADIMAGDYDPEEIPYY